MNRKIIIFALFIALGVLFRFPSFNRSVIDHDESTYILIADAMMDGDQLYVDRVDTKPPGIFVLFYIFLKIIKNGIFSVRLFASLFVSITAFCIYILSKRLWKEELAALLSGLLYIVLTSISSFSLSANTEIFFLFFITAGLLSIYKQEENTIRYFFFGLFLGLAVIIKQVVLLEVFLFGLVALGYHINKKHKFGIIFKRALLYITGTFLPAAFVFAVFAGNGHLNELIEYTYFIPGRYPSPIDPVDLLDFIISFHIRYFFVIIPFYTVTAYHIIKKTKQIYVSMITVVLWFCVICIAVIIPGKFFQHYYMQLFPVISIVSPGILLLFKPVYLRLSSRISLTMIIIIPILFGGTFTIQKYYFSGMDIPRKIKTDIEPLLDTGEEIFVGRQYQILYYLLDKKPLTKYVHPSLLSNSEHIQAIGYDNVTELNNILTSQPRFIITKGEYPIQWVEEYITSHYSLYKWYDNTVRVMLLDKRS